MNRYPSKQGTNLTLKSDCLLGDNDKKCLSSGLSLSHSEKVTNGRLQGPLQAPVVPPQNEVSEAYYGTSESMGRSDSAVRSSKADNFEYFVLDGEVVARETLVANPNLVA